MESVILPCKSIFPTISELSQNYHPKSKIPINYEPRFTDTHLNYLCTNGRLSEAITALESISQYGYKVKPETFSKLIESCINSKSLPLGRKLHKKMNFLLKKVYPFIETKLLGMYSKCGSLQEAYVVFDEMRERDLFAWSAMIGACSRDSRWGDVVDLFYMMMEDGIVPDSFLFPKILQACGNCGDVETGRLIHSIAIRCGMSSEIRVNNSLLAVYAKCGLLICAKRLFESMEKTDIVSWNSIIMAYCHKGEIVEARRLLDLMHLEGVEPGLITWNTLIASHNQLGKCDEALEVMKEMEGNGIVPDVFSWTCMISGLAQHNRNSQALELFREMSFNGVTPSEVTLTSIISACASLKDLKKGRELHSLVVKLGFDGEEIVGNALIDLYSKCGKLEAARLVFDMIPEKDVYSWNSMIGGYCQAGYFGKAHDLFTKMHESEVSPNVITWNVMITGHMQNGDEDQALDLFWRMEKGGSIEQDTASWNALIAGYLQNGQKDKALGMFRKMQSFGFKPNAVTILSILPACSNLIAAKKVKEIHCCVLRCNLENELSVANSLIDTYSKSGGIKYSKEILDGMSTKDIISWNTLIAGYVLHGCSSEAIKLFHQMKEAGLKPNRGTFSSVISSYGLAKMVDEGKSMFSSMSEEYRIVPGLEHCVAMVNLYGRSDKLEEAIEFIDNMTMERDISVWGALLTASRMHGNLTLAIHAGEQLLKLDSENVVIYQLLLQLYALRGISEESVTVLRPRKRNHCEESLSWSWTEINNVVYAFASGQQSNSEVPDSWIKRKEVKMEGSSSCNRLCIREEEKEDMSRVHSEKLALSFTLIKNPQSSRVIRIVKNLRMCEDCHRTAKFISQKYEREIYIHDSKCLHHFKDGYCSCGNYW
ncbi:pentatricopeptide repeat-containing protein At1g19720 [Nicotiana tomentosiformis]|uniref:pentatricopeptide repeat-containing protein At1g19720 n=1 Tax=Nicotiana tomentosiformis TaxID=4098 RepID=UPI00051BCCC9|nr:pentatricopeptide repeat-containing protein At1g19720 [Nicotiana tomentosiformis]XP_018626895.1 pentatricopeptide repeat-containing protein At1g19720 [Nicotiana tomentosiformis]XP_033512545.1 pentatricopeptide repeat-containing protein At1g19720 [Nicotiana tomentosiformis]